MSEPAAPTAPTWYDVLGVDEHATADQISAAWSDAVVGLGPTDRRFRLLNQAAETLLDADSRARYDAGLATDPDVAPLADPAADPDPRPASRQRWSLRRTPAPDPDPDPDVPTAEPTAKPVPTSAAAEPDARSGAEDAAPAAPRRGPSAWLLVPVAVLTAVLVAVAAHLATQPSDDAIATSTDDAQSAAERAATTILAYDYRHMSADQKAADALMTPSYAQKYNALFAQLVANAPTVKPVVTATVLASGIVRSGDDRVQVLVFVNQDSTRADSQERVDHNQARFTMVRSGDTWLVDDIAT